MYGELINLGLNSREAETFNYLVNKMVGELNLDMDDPPFVDDASLIELLYCINNLR